MKAIIFAGGLGSRISEESHLRPKPLIEIGGRPLLWHIMKIYSAWGVHEFVICCGYKGYLIKEYFANYFLHMSDVTFDMRDNSMHVHQRHVEPWRVTLVDTGEHTATGGRLKKVLRYVEDEEFFFLTYGDGLAKIDIARQAEFHRRHGKLATITAVRPPGRYGALQLNDGAVSNFQEKPPGDGGWINGGFFVLNPQVIEHIADDNSSWEEEPLRTLSNENELMAWEHNGFWQTMDTLRDKVRLEEMWNTGKPPWKCW